MHGHILAWMRYKGILKNRNINFIIFDWQTKRHKNINKRMHNIIQVFFMKTVSLVLISF